MTTFNTEGGMEETKGREGGGRNEGHKGYKKEGKEGGKNRRYEEISISHFTKACEVGGASGLYGEGIGTYTVSVWKPMKNR
jgi:hypothetical protein